jgi:hypothetical protein
MAAGTMCNPFKNLIQRLGVLALLGAAGCGDMLGEQDQPSVDSCEVGGCSRQFCHEPGEQYGGGCEWEESYACYDTATCERQANGKCDWTPTEELQSCLGQ